MLFRSTLIERLLDDDRFDVYGFDLNDSNIKHLKQNPKFYFFKGDIKLSRKTIEYHISQCDIILPLAAIATPADYIINPIKVFELDFEENLHLVRLCHKYNKRLIFPSTSEVYGMCTDKEFDEKDSNLILGPISKQRWIYSCSKQLLDRIIWAYGKDNLHFTLFRPFNWIGPKLDSFEAAKNIKQDLLLK